MNEFKVKKEDRILVVAPHPDDESIGCGGMLSIYGKQCDILVLTDGCLGYKGKYTEEQKRKLVNERKNEVKESARIAGVKNVFFLDIPDNQLYRSYKKVSGFDFSPYAFIFVPNRFEAQTDHKATHPIICRIKKQSLGRVKGKIIEYEVWTPIVKPTTIYDISPHIGTKKRMIEAHKTQLRDIDYVSKAIALSEYRGMYENIRYGEAFSYYSVKERIKFRILYLPESIRRPLLSMIGKV